MKKVLVLGAGGFIGSHLIEYILLQTDWEITAITHQRGIPKRIRQINCYKQYSSRITVIIHDLFKKVPATKIKKIGAINYVINAASKTKVSESLKNPHFFMKNNIDLMFSVLELVKNLKPEKFIHISTDEVYGEALLNQKHTEWSPHNPPNPYSASKSAQESLAISYWRIWGVPLVIVNPTNSFGERQSDTKFIARCISQIKEGKLLKIYLIEGKIPVRAYEYVVNQASAIVFLLNNCTIHVFQPSVCVVPQRYNISSQYEKNNLQVAEKISSLLKTPFKYKLFDYSRERGIAIRQIIDGSKLKKLGWEAPISFNEALLKTFKHQNDIK